MLMNNSEEVLNMGFFSKMVERQKECNKKFAEHKKEYLKAEEEINIMKKKD